MSVATPNQSSIHLHSSAATESMLCHHHNLYTHHQHQPTKSFSTLNNLTIPETISRYHSHQLAPNQTSSSITQHISAPLSTVWSLLSQFDNPQLYKQFLKHCNLLTPDARAVGALREVHVISGLPAATSTERLDILDDDRHVIGFSVVGGDHRLSNYKSVTTLHSSGKDQTVVVESYEVDVPEENSKEDTCVFVDTIVRCNLQSLAKIAQTRRSVVAARG